jgi:hypothetical protein
MLNSAVFGLLGVFRLGNRLVPMGELILGLVFVGLVVWHYGRKYCICWGGCWWS